MRRYIAAVSAGALVRQRFRLEALREFQDPTLEILPSSVEVPEMLFCCTTSFAKPVAPTKRPVPPTKVRSELMVTEPGVPVGTIVPVEVTNSSSPLAAVMVAPPTVVRVRRLTHTETTSVTLPR